ncbi:hypothetical protein D3C78_1234310 [compost metagenome]
MALHEREVQRPAAQAEHRNPQQLLLQEEAQQRQAAVEVVLQDEDVDPALVVADHQAGAAHLQLLESLDLPLGILHPLHPRPVAVGPAGGDLAHQAPAQRLGGAERQQLEQRQGEQRPAPQQGVESQQQAGDGTAQRRGQVSEHRGFSNVGRQGRMILQPWPWHKIAGLGRCWRTIVALRTRPHPPVPQRVAFNPAAT